MSSAHETLRRDFGGDIIEPGAAEYESARRSVLASGQSGLRPAARERRGRASGVRFAASAGLVLSVRGGGHGFAGFGTNDGGVVIDLSKLADVEIIDKERHLVRIGGGATWGQVAARLGPARPGDLLRRHQERRCRRADAEPAASAGRSGSTVWPWTTWSPRRWSPPADRSCMRARQENPELFWAIRGGGGNFGIVTAFEFVAHPTTDVFFGKIAFPAREAATVLQGWADYLRTAPEELTSIAVFANPFAGGPDAPVEIHVAFDGDDPRARRPGHRPDPPARHGDRRRRRAETLRGHARGWR